MKTSYAALAVLIALAGLPACKARAAEAPVTLQTDDQKTLYALGMLLGRNVGQFGLSAAEIEIIKKGLQDAATGQKPEVDMEVFGPKVQQFAQARAAAGAEVQKTKGQAYCDTAAKDTGAVKTPSGLIFKTITPGTGASPAATDTVKVHYEGKLIDGTVFDSSKKGAGQPIEFPLNGVIPCWTEGVQRMKVGEKARLVCPSSIAYGDRGRPGIPGGATLDFEVELVSIAGKK
jgi:FKBP-type peptidyl-prolyl cis-trans isomerase FkpA